MILHFQNEIHDITINLFEFIKTKRALGEFNIILNSINMV
jgi:hypothetical protein